jgi:hypothetical protein
MFPECGGTFPEFGRTWFQLGPVGRPGEEGVELTVQLADVRTLCVTRRNRGRSEAHTLHNPLPQCSLNIPGMTAAVDCFSATVATGANVSAISATVIVGLCTQREQGERPVPVEIASQ